MELVLSYSIFGIQRLSLPLQDLLSFNNVTEKYNSVMEQRSAMGKINFPSHRPCSVHQAAAAPAQEPWHEKWQHEPCVVHLLCAVELPSLCSMQHLNLPELCFAPKKRKEWTGWVTCGGGAEEQTSLPTENEWDRFISFYVCDAVLAVKLQTVKWASLLTEAFRKTVPPKITWRIFVKK